MFAVCNSGFHSRLCYASPFTNRLFHGSDGESPFIRDCVMPLRLRTGCFMAQTVSHLSFETVLCLSVYEQAVSWLRRRVTFHSRLYYASPFTNRLFHGSNGESPFIRDCVMP